MIQIHGKSLKGSKLDQETGVILSDFDLSMFEIDLEIKVKYKNLYIQNDIKCKTLNMM